MTILGIQFLVSTNEPARKSAIVHAHPQVCPSNARKCRSKVEKRKCWTTCIKSDALYAERARLIVETHSQTSRNAHAGAARLTNSPSWRLRPLVLRFFGAQYNCAPSPCLPLRKIASPTRISPCESGDRQVTTSQL